MLDMIQECVSVILIIQIHIIKLLVKTHEIPIYNLNNVGPFRPYPLPISFERINKQDCFFNNKWVECSSIYNQKLMNSISKYVFEDNILPFYDSTPYNRIRELNSNLRSFFSEPRPMYRRFYMPNPPGLMNMYKLPDLYGKLPAQMYQMQHFRHPSVQRLNSIPRPETRHNFNSILNMPHQRPHASSGLSLASQSIQINSSSNVAHGQLTLKPLLTKGVSNVSQQMPVSINMTSMEKFTQSLDHFERQFYMITFSKLTTISPADRQENGMSFVQSGFFLLLTLMALWNEVDYITRAEIDRCLGFQVSDMDSIGIIKHFMTTLPNSTDKLKFRRSSRLMLWPGREVSPRFRAGAAAALMLHVDRFNGTETSEKIVSILNRMVETDSGGAIHDTFDEDDVSGGATAVLVTTLYLRGGWRAAPTVLNGTRTFRDADNAPQRTVRMIRINDNMNYADLHDWNAQAIEISYGTPGLSLLMLIPRSNSLRSLVKHVTNTSLGDIKAKMRTMRVAATVPLYTLRMTLLLPNKLEALGIPRLVDVSNVTQVSSMRLSHAIQRIMFWAEAGRNAYKDDGIEWDQAPEMEVVVDRPYIFFVRWHNLTIMNGNFVL